MAEEEVKQFLARVRIKPGAKKVSRISDAIFIDGGKSARATGLAIAYNYVEDLSVVWYFGDGTVEYHDCNGKLLRIVSLPGDNNSQSMVA